MSNMLSKEQIGLKRLNIPTHIDYAIFNKLEAEGWLRFGSHPFLPLAIWNYTQKCVFEKYWTEETTMARGLVVESNTGKIIGRPLKKFFNFEEHYGPLPGGSYEIREKVDGSLIILFYYNNNWMFATKGSFVSEQSLEAKLIWNEKYSDVELDKDYSYLFEVIYPNNRIVVDYGPRRDLVFLAKINTKTAEERFPYQDAVEYPFSVPEFYGLHSGKENPIALRLLEEPNKEGFVLRYHGSGLLLKLKFYEYLRLHKIMTGFTEKNIWESLMKGGRSELINILERVPDEFYQWADKIANELEKKFALIEHEALVDFVNIPDGTRAEKAEYIKKTKHPHILFAMLDKKEHTEYVWKLIKPVVTTTYKIET